LAFESTHVTLKSLGTTTSHHRMFAGTAEISGTISATLK